MGLKQEISFVTPFLFHAIIIIRNVINPSRMNKTERLVVWQSMYNVYFNTIKFDSEKCQKFLPTGGSLARWMIGFFTHSYSTYITRLWQIADEDIAVVIVHQM